MPIEPPPDKPGSTDVAITIAKAVVSAVPIAGGPAAELFDLLRLPAAKRQWNWLSDVAERLNKLEGEHRLRVEDVVQSDAFVSATVRGLEVARRTSEEAKRAALRNAVLNVALARSPEDALTQFFLDCIDRFTEWHLVVLKAFADPLRWVKEHNLSYEPATTNTPFKLAGFLEAAFPELASRPDLTSVLWGDLTVPWLLVGPLITNMAATGWGGAHITDLGKRFLALIEEPV
jgi:hypothetical protein